MSTLALLTAGPSERAVSSALPALELLAHQVVTLDLDPAAALREDVAVLLVDATTSLVQARSTVRTLHTMGLGVPLVGIFTEGGLAALDDQWPLDDILLTTAGPAEVRARLRMVLARGAAGAPAAETPDATSPVRVADVVVDEGAWTVRAGGQPLDLTYKEFELLKYLVHHPGRVVTREILLQEVWGMDYYGGTRTVDVHIRRLRAKLGPERESLIGTIRNVGYRFAGPRDTPSGDVVK
ncbi:winged helix-turn-helix transcriptional regulator [Ornithinicoccus hortensis]|uniref:DNA-binding response OmpR family regulator n=1 Tax=Ornithinicoccus hortensis TaxID=82346 RepID=A0A542YNY8_9MICO|nr:response regulator transcription factor [Ornithinicoccus hortensis]TQL49820.1 DNA-binding response OmpR family regulator [Ornithinicoccus hortensis]